MNSFARGNERTYITHLPGYKIPVLAIGNKSVIHKIASFDTEEEAKIFCQMLNNWLNLNEKEEE